MGDRGGILVVSYRAHVVGGFVERANVARVFVVVDDVLLGHGDEGVRNIVAIGDQNIKMSHEYDPHKKNAE